MASCQRSININESLDKVFSSQKDLDLKASKNNYTNYIDYYCPSDLFEIDSDGLSYVFRFNDSSLIMNINIAGIINSRYYDIYNLVDEGFFDSSKLVYERNDVYFTEVEDKEFSYRLYKQDDIYLIYFLTNEMVFYALANEDDLIPLTEKILFLTKTANIKEDAVIANYSNKDIIDYEKKQVNLFETTMPVSGKIDELLIHDENNDEIEQ